MSLPSADVALSFWQTLSSWPEAALAVDMFYALFLGFLFGYERSYHGRAAGMRTYGLVCMVAAVLTSVSAHPELWHSGNAAVNNAIIDPTRTIQGIVTGIGFLGAGIIMKDGFRISGLTTAASIWASAAIGVLVGLEFYLGAFVMTVLAEAFVLLGSRFDVMLPSRRPIFVSLKFRKDQRLHEAAIIKLTNENGYDVARNSISITSDGGGVEWRFVAVALNRRRNIGLSGLADALSGIEGLENFHLSRARN